VDIDNDGRRCDAEVVDNGDGTYKVYTPQHSGNLTVNVTLDQDDKTNHVADSPYKLSVEQKVDASKTLCHGPGLEDGILDTQPTYFDIETRDQDGKPIGEKAKGMPFVVDIQGPDGPVPAKVTDNGDGTYRVEYEPTKHGDHKIEVTLEDEATGKPEQVADSPYHIRVDPGAWHGTTNIEEYTFVVSTKQRDGSRKTVGGELEHFSVVVDGPGDKVEAKIVDLNDGRYVVSYSLPELGTYKISCRINGKDIVGSPFTVTNQ